MKILYYSRPYFGDCDLPLIKAMRNQGHDVTVLFSMNPRSLHTTVFDINEIYPQNGIFPISIYPELCYINDYTALDDIYISNEITGKFSWSSFKLALKVLCFFRKGNYDIIQYVETPSIFHFLPLWFFRKRLVVTIHDGKSHTGEANRIENFIRRVVKHYVNKFIVLNKAEVDVFSEEFKVQKDKIFTSHLGYYEMLSLYGNTEKKQENYILFFGRISPYKGIEYLLQAMEIIHETHPHIKVIVAGSGTFYFDISKYKNLDYIDFRNYFINLDELADLIRGSMFTVCPYTDATQSGVVYSSFALNKPVVATSVGGLPEMIEDGKTGLIVLPRNTEALASAFLYLLDQPYILQQMSDNISESSRIGKGSWDIIAKEYINIYQK